MKRIPVKFEKITDLVLRRAAQIVDDKAFLKMFSHRNGYRLVISFRDTDDQDIKFLMEHFGGYYTPPKEGDTFHWLSLQQMRGFMFIDAVQPFLVKKKERSGFIIQMKELVAKNKRRKMTPESLGERMALIEKLMELNRIAAQQGEYV